jgi:plasmid stabilization system protein ParE
MRATVPTSRESSPARNESTLGGKRVHSLQLTDRRPPHPPRQSLCRRAFLEAVYEGFEFLARDPGIGRTRAGLGFPEVRSWRVDGFRRYLIFYRELPGRIQIWRVLHGARDLNREITGH